MKKRILSIVLATLLIAAMAIPASATSISTGRTWNGVLYQTNDTCYTGNFHCVIECDSMDYTLKTTVDAYKNNNILIGRYPGTSSVLISSNAVIVGGPISYIYAYHYLNENLASSQKVYAS